MIPRQTVEQILDAAKIEGVVGDFVTLKHRGANLVACCPFHNEKTPSFYVSPAKGIFKCFGCGKSGTAVGFIMEHENLTYTEALKYLAKKYGIEVVEKEETAEDIAARQRGESLMLVSEFAKSFFTQQLTTPEGQIGYAYFKSRGLEDETIALFGLGWAPQGRDKLQKAARGAGFKEEYLIDTGLCFKTEDGKVLDRFYDRVVFPIQNVAGRVIAFGCRTLKNDKTVAKYVNSPETEIYQKRTTLYGMYQAKNEVHKQDKFILVEGYLDVISMHQLGIKNVAASSGTSLTVEQVRLIKRFTDNVTIIYDGDSAGIHAALRGIGLVLEGGLNVKVVLLPDGDDPDSFARKHTLQEVQDFIKDNEQDFIGFKTRMLLDDAGNDPIKRATLINDIADTIALIPDPVKRGVYVPFAAGELRIDEQLLFDRIKHTREKMLEEKRREKERQAAESAQGGYASGFDGGIPGDQAPWPDSDPYSAQGPATDSYVGVPLAQDPLINDKTLAPCEAELLRFILRNGRTPLLFDVDSEYYNKDLKEAPTVAEFIDGSLFADEIVFSNESYAKTYAQYFQLYNQGLPQETISVRMMSDPDDVIREISKRLIQDDYVLTVKKFEASLTKENTVLTTFVPKAIMSYSRARVEKQIKELTKTLESLAQDDEKAIAIMSEIMKLNKYKKVITNKLGRV